jgi:hypothetical protein
LQIQSSPCPAIYPTSLAHLHIHECPDCRAFVAQTPNDAAVRVIHLETQVLNPSILGEDLALCRQHSDLSSTTNGDHVKLQSRQLLALAIAFAGTFAASSASAFVNGSGDAWSTIHNGTNKCIRAYVYGRTYDVMPGKSQTVLVSPDGGYNLVSIFPSSRCGGRAARNVWFDSWAKDWWVK